MFWLNTTRLTSCMFDVLIHELAACPRPIASALDVINGVRGIGLLQGRVW